MTRLDISGPIQGGSHGRAFGATLTALGDHGYVEEEYFFAGAATSFAPVGEPGPDGHWVVRPDRTAPFATRALVRRPADPERFNGTVLVEWNNVSMGCEIFEQGDTSVIFDEGFAYVGVSAQRVGLSGFETSPQGLVAWDGDRYRTLAIRDDTFSYDIFSQIARAVGPRRDTTGGPDPLGGLAVRQLLAVGGSQSAARLCSYINAVQPIEQVFDGFIVFTWFGSGSSLDDPAAFEPALGATGRPPTYVTQLRDDLSVPVMVVNSECEALSCQPSHRADTDRYRYWEVAGAPHGPRLHMERILPKLVRDQVVDAGAFDLEALVPVPWGPVLDAAIGHVNQWIQGGAPPPVQPRIVVEGQPPHIVRDPDGNAMGGVRVPEMGAAILCNVGAMEEAGDAGLMGRWSPLPGEVVRRRYPARESYLAAYQAAADAAVAAGVLRQHDAEAGVGRARDVELW